jgi:hypothetical protein
MGELPTKKARTWRQKEKLITAYGIWTLAAVALPIAAVRGDIRDALFASAALFVAILVIWRDRHSPATG